MPSGFDLTICIPCGATGSASALLNVVLFLPLGAALAARGMGITPVTVASLGLSLLIELAQVWIPGRHAVVGDVLVNGIGGGLGAVAFRTAGAWLRVGTARAWAIAAGAVGSIAVTPVLLAPLPTDSAYYGHWTARLGHLAWYRGRVLAAHLDTIPLPSTRLEPSDRIRDRLFSGGTLTVLALAGPPVHRLGSLFHLSDLDQRNQFLIGPDRGDLVFSWRTRASALSLDSPVLRIPGALAGVRPGDTLRVSARLGDDGFCFRVNDRANCPATLSVASGWALLFYPQGMGRALRRFMDFAWAAGLAVLVAFWSPGARTAMLTVPLLAATLIVTAALSVLLSVAWLEMAGLLVGALAGGVARGALRLMRPGGGPRAVLPG